MPRQIDTGSAHRYSKDAFKYTAFPIIKVGATLTAQLAAASINATVLRDQPDKHITVDPERMEYVAGGAISLLYMALTGYWALREAKEIDDNFRYVISAEFGIEPDRVTFSHYRQSGNTILQREYLEFQRLNRDRFLADGVGLVTSGLGFVHTKLKVDRKEAAEKHTEDVAKLELDRGRQSSGILVKILKAITDGKTAEEAIESQAGEIESLSRTHKKIENLHEAYKNKTSPGLDRLLSVTNSFAPLLTHQMIYGQQSVNWFSETYFVDKSSHFSTIEMARRWDPVRDGTYRHINADDLWDIYQRTRRDGGVPMVVTEEERQLYEPVLHRLADAFNNTDRYFDRMARSSDIYDETGNVLTGQGGIGIPEIMYLFGDRFLALAAKYKNAIDTQPELQDDYNRLFQGEMISEIINVQEKGLIGIMRERHDQLDSGRERTTFEEMESRKTVLDRLLDRIFEWGTRWAAENRYTRSELWARSIEERRELSRTPDVYQSVPGILGR